MIRPVTIGVSLKMYFGHAQARAWFAEIARILAPRRAVAAGGVEVFVAPTYVQLLPALKAFAGTGARIAAQDVGTHDHGPFTGEVSAAELAEIGVSLAGIGHAERRRLYGETDSIVAAKTAAALRNGITPVLCIGELVRDAPDVAATTATMQLRSALSESPAGRVIVAYEPVWAIGAGEPAPIPHIRTVCRAIRTELDALARTDGAVIYGGSAGPGLLTELGGDVDGLFLGRFAHDPNALAQVLDEAAARAGQSNDPRPSERTSP